MARQDRLDRRSDGSAVGQPVLDEAITAATLLHAAHARLAEVVERTLRPRFGLGVPVFDLLVHLARSPGEELTMTELAGATGLTRGGATRLVDRAAGAGLVERVPCAVDRRVVHVRPTAAGRDLLDAAAPPCAAALAEAFAALDAGERAALTGLLRRVVEPPAG